MNAPSKREHLKVQVWIYTSTKQDELRVLLLLTRPERGGFWQPVTGSVESGETLMDAAFREATEETGLAFEAPPFSLDHDFTFEARGKKFHEYGFGIAVPQLENPILDSHEHIDFKWVSIDDAMKHLKHTSNIKILSTLKKKLRQLY